MWKPCARLQLAVGALLACGCGGGGEALPPLDYPDPLTTGASEIAPPVAADGVTRLDLACTEGAAETCNAFDDDCDGEVDEGCGFEPGQIQVTAAWNSEADLALVVHPPGDDAADGGVDRDGRGGCTPDAERGRMEHAAWAEAVPGVWSVALSTTAACGHEGPTTATVSLSVNGRSFGPYNRTLEPEGSGNVLSFEIP